MSSREQEDRWAAARGVRPYPEPPQHDDGTQDFTWTMPDEIVARDTDGTILRGPALPCGCPLDADCDGRHAGRE
jgi:hypothetical protein